MSGTDHHHDHDAHAEIGSGARPGYYDIMETAVRELLVEKKLIGAGRNPPPDRGSGFAHAGARRQGRGARLGRSRLPPPAAGARPHRLREEFGITFYDDTDLIVLENTDKVHNLIVCTLCSCYPRPVLGLPPDWYKLKPYRARAVSEPRAVLAEFGTILPDDVEVRVSDSTAMVRYLVLPMRPEGTEHYTEEQLAALVTRDTMIGVVPARIPSESAAS